MKTTTKRNRTARAVILAGAAALVLAGCDGEESNVAFISKTDPAYCMQNNLGMTETECRDALREAEEEHARAAPRYDNRELCLQDLEVDECEEVRTPDGSSSFMPFFMGYMIGNSLGSSDRDYDRKRYVGRPYYVTKSGSAFTADGGSYGKAYQKPATWTKAPAAAIKPITKPAAVMTKATVTSRGGFSATRASFGG